MDRLPGTALSEGLEGGAGGHGRRRAGCRRRRGRRPDLLGEDATRGRHAAGGREGRTSTDAAWAIRMGGEDEINHSTNYSITMTFDLIGSPIRDGLRIPAGARRLLLSLRVRDGRKESAARRRRPGSCFPGRRSPSEDVRVIRRSAEKPPGLRI